MERVKNNSLEDCYQNPSPNLVAGISFSAINCRFLIRKSGFSLT